MLTTSVLPAVVTETIPVVTVCTAGPCTHGGIEQKHDKKHVLCEHCTVGVVECAGCELVLTGMNENDMEVLGWVCTGDGNGLKWACPTCSVRQQESDL